MDKFSFQCNPKASNIIWEQDGIRVSLLTPGLLRLETGSFTDLPTQTVWNRDLGFVPCQTEKTGTRLAVRTVQALFELDIRHGKMLAVTPIGGQRVTHFRAENLLGTARTLDMVNGATKLDRGILSRSGVSELDDSRSLLLQGSSILPRPKCSDRYYFAYGHNYLLQLKDYFRMTGPVPLIPKFALGNWWSRYRAYTQEEYQELMTQFIDRKIPVTVATIDMDWHWTDVIQRFGPKAKPGKPKTREEVLYNFALPGWTGYSWNTELFPHHRQLLSWLHEQGFRVPLNVHPAQGIRPFEDCYDAVCQHVGIDPALQKTVPFDITDHRFLEAYFEAVHHPLEDEGVDFWWIDWQQGTRTRTPGLDPLWALNHYHTLDSGRKNRRPLILSRYAGLGSHRYPLGFSGDTFCTWKSLDFQPYFTNTAANAGYTWWSHDIGGHQQGKQDDELYLRWLQYGVFSPINRLHSSNSDFMGKEPWKRSWAVARIAEDFLRYRHKLIPYLYSANYQTHTEGIPLCMPLYYRYDSEEAYRAKNQYLFGSQLLVCPITQPMDRRLNLAAVRVWLPEGRWTDVFTGQIYRGGRWVTMYRDLDSIPVLAGEGSIVPMYQSAVSNCLSLSQPLEIHVWRGNGHFELYEDDGETNAYQSGSYAVTTFDFTGDETALRFTICPPVSSQGLLPESRQMTVLFRDIYGAKVTVNGVPVAFENQRVTVDVGTADVVMELKDLKFTANRPCQEIRSDLLTRVQWSNNRKTVLFRDGRMPRFIKEALKESEALWYE